MLTSFDKSASTALGNADLMDHPTGLLNRLAEDGAWTATFGTGFLIAVLSAIANTMPAVLVGALPIEAPPRPGSSCGRR